MYLHKNFNLPKMAKNLISFTEHLLQALYGVNVPGECSVRVSEAVPSSGFWGQASGHLGAHEADCL